VCIFATLLGMFVTAQIVWFTYLHTLQWQVSFTNI